jgi:hypothetical protein
MMLMKKQRKKNHHIFTNFSYTLNDTPGRGPATNTKINHVRITDSFATCTDNSGKPLLSRESSDTMAYKKDSKKDEKSCETVLGLYGEHTSNYYSIEKYEPFTSNKQSRKHVMNVAPQSINSLPHAPNRSQNAASSDRSIPTLALPSQQVTPVNGPVKVLSHVGITYIEPLTAHLKKMSTSPPLENENISIKSRQANPSLSTPYHFSNTMAQSMNKKYHAVPAPLDRYAGNGMKSNDSKPSSPRPVELQKAIIPEAMQAVTQKTDDYLLSASPDSRKIQTSSSSNRSRSPAPQHAMPRTSSVRNMPPMGHQQHLHPSQHQRPNNNQQGRPTSPQPHYRSNPSSPQMPRSNGHTAPYPNQQYPGGKVQPPNYNKPMPSPTLSPSTSSNTARRPPHSPRMQQSPTQYYPSSSSGHLNSPPQSVSIH